MTRVPRVAHQELWHSLGCQGDGNRAFHDLVQRYGAPRRHYHTLRHVVRVLDGIDEILAGQAVPSSAKTALQWAAWYHDAVLTWGAQDDVLASAMLARNVAVEAGLGHDFATEVFLLVVGTEHRADARPDAALGGILCDADLAILGAEEAEFAEYEAAVRREWWSFSFAAFAVARANILAGFLERPRIYHTAYAHERWDARARRNLTRSIAALREPA